jgi:hypothetical protein
MLCGLISQTSAEMPPKNGGVRKANYMHKSGKVWFWPAIFNKKDVMHAKAKTLIISNMGKLDLCT